MKYFKKEFCCEKNLSGSANGTEHNAGKFRAEQSEEERERGRKRK